MVTIFCTVLGRLTKLGTLFNVYYLYSVIDDNNILVASNKTAEKMNTRIKVKVDRMTTTGFEPALMYVSLQCPYHVDGDGRSDITFRSQLFGVVLVEWFGTLD